LIAGQTARNAGASFPAHPDYFHSLSEKVEGFCCPVPSKPLNSLLLPGGFNRA
tara:strand:+ start:477 stop:635 length:159 start_codon:yes stop_codon:yes gene_type:complete